MANFKLSLLFGVIALALLVSTHISAEEPTEGKDTNSAGNHLDANLVYGGYGGYGSGGYWRYDPGYGRFGGYGRDPYGYGGGYGSGYGGGYGSGYGGLYGGGFGYGGRRYYTYQNGYNTYQNGYNTYG